MTFELTSWNLPKAKNYMRGTPNRKNLYWKDTTHTLLWEEQLRWGRHTTMEVKAIQEPGKGLVKSNFTTHSGSREGDNTKLRLPFLCGFMLDMSLYRLLFLFHLLAWLDLSCLEMSENKQLKL